MTLWNLSAEEHRQECRCHGKKVRGSKTEH